MAPLASAALGIGPSLLIFLVQVLVSVRNALPVIRVVLPCILTGPVVEIVLTVVDIGLAVKKVVVVVYVNIVATPVETAVKCCPCHKSCGEGDKIGRGHISRGIYGIGWVGRICPSPVNNCRVVDRYIDNLGVSRLDLNDLFFDYNLLFLSCLQCAGGLCLGTEPLNRIHNILFLGQKRIAQFCCPVEFFVEHRENLRDIGERFDACIPRLALKRRIETVPLEGRVRLEPPVRLDNLKGIGGCHEYLAQEGIGIEGDRCQHLIELCSGCNRCRRRVLILAVGKRSRQAGYRHHSPQKQTKHGDSFHGALLK